jgi:hypothetical protein
MTLIHKFQQKICYFGPVIAVLLLLLPSIQLNSGALILELVLKIKLFVLTLELLILLFSGSFY